MHSYSKIYFTTLKWCILVPALIASLFAIKMALTYGFVGYGEVYEPKSWQAILFCLLFAITIGGGGGLFWGAIVISPAVTLLWFLSHLLVTKLKERKGAKQEDSTKSTRFP